MSGKARRVAAEQGRCVLTRLFLPPGTRGTAIVVRPWTDDTLRKPPRFKSFMSRIDREHLDAK
jgi:hypothetical protein